jgi:hypothetical protein
MLNRSMFVFAALLFAAPVFVSAVAYGETGTEPATTTTQQRIDDGGVDVNDTNETETEAQKTERETRIKKLKDVQKVKLAAAEKKKIQTNCQAAQGKVSSVSGRFKGIETSRGEVHKNVVNHLNELVVKLKAKGADTTQLEANIATLNTKIETFNTDLATYKQSVSDLKALDCKTDPEGFKAALTTARTNLEKVRADATDIHSYLKDTIKPLLKTIRTQIEEATESTQESTTEQEGGTQ